MIYIAFSVVCTAATVNALKCYFQNEEVICSTEMCVKAIATLDRIWGTVDYMLINGLLFLPISAIESRVS